MSAQEELHLIQEPGLPKAYIGSKSNRRTAPPTFARGVSRRCLSIMRPQRLFLYEAHSVANTIGGFLT
ncbi:hypothetical protein SAMN04490190_1739 [Pseudomonas libanensis]|uniref:Uncharacterized protein n=1 Tax=Pseudomonas libanensis TaxID=75588 RepID=A0A0R2YBX3_9PSED|nr:hypothetical protein TU73_11905 [Pseudomonas libanensis]SDK80923.1 hypothetical protein SAMN04490190_1739 [Pseudomonas libanensis]